MFSRFIISHIDGLTKFIFHTLYFIFLFSLSITAVINPGIPERKYYLNNYTNERQYSKCKKCNIIVLNELKIGHCIDCDICIQKYDHHCTWAGKCIGKKNVIFFYCFTISLFGFIIVSIFSIFNYFLFNKSK